MLNQYPLWKYLILIAVFILGSLYAMPNLFGDDPAVQISHRSHPMVEDDKRTVEDTLKNSSIAFKKIELEQNKLLIRFDFLKCNRTIF